MIYTNKKKEKRGSIGREDWTKTRFKPIRANIKSYRFMSSIQAHGDLV
jgi:hypothetical protein